MNKVKLKKPKWKPPFLGWKPDPETEVSKHKNIRKKAKKHLVFPDVLPTPFTPYLILHVEYSPDVVVRKGHILPPAKLQETPRVSWPSPPNKRWTLIMTTPDDPELVPDDVVVTKSATVIPVDPALREKEVLHWMVTNISGSDLSSGQVLCNYLPPLPMKHGGGHRYVFILFEQLDGETHFDVFPHSSVKDYDERKSWNTFKFQEKYGLKPKGMAFFKATWDKVVSAQYANIERAEPQGRVSKDVGTPYFSRKWMDVTKWYETAQQ